jgi:peptidoglycan/LPS O-acetylase OafA/YrhL
MNLTPVRERLDSIQLLRAFAALFVCFGHVLASAVSLAESHHGAFERPALSTGAGVDIFFLISGFIMVFASDRLFGRPESRGVFLARRLARIVPLYWATTTLFLAIKLAGAVIHHEPAPSVKGIVTSYLFIPSTSTQVHEGVVHPLFSLGWTLNYEMFFYVLFSLFIVLPRDRAIGWLAATMIALVAIGQLVPWMPTAPEFWVQPIVLEFVLGMGVALLRQRQFSLPLAVRLAMIGAGIAWLVADPMGLAPGVGAEATPNDFTRLAGWGAPMFLIFSGTVLGRDFLPKRFEQLAGGLGDASYSLYLLHPFVVVAAGFAWGHVHGGLQHFYWLYIFLTLVAASVTAILAHRLFERPVVAATQRYLTRRRAVPAAAAEGG